MPLLQPTDHVNCCAVLPALPAPDGAAFGDDYTTWHCQRVAGGATELARDAGLDEHQLCWFRVGALLHDIGKSRIPRAILEKRGRLTPDEMAIVRQHPVDGATMLAALPLPWDVRPMVLHHHERWDGTGYPDGLAGTDIPFTARLLSIADVFDALTVERPYRPAYTEDEAISLLRAERGRMFDPELVDLFLHRTLPRLMALAESRELHSPPRRLVRRRTPLELRTVSCQA